MSYSFMSTTSSKSANTAANSSSTLLPNLPIGAQILQNYRNASSVGLNDAPLDFHNPIPKIENPTHSSSLSFPSTTPSQQTSTSCQLKSVKVEKTVPDSTTVPPSVAVSAAHYGLTSTQPLQAPPPQHHQTPNPTTSALLNMNFPYMNMSGIGGIGNMNSIYPSLDSTNLFNMNGFGYGMPNVLAAPTSQPLAAAAAAHAAAAAAAVAANQPVQPSNSTSVPGVPTAASTYAHLLNTGSSPNVPLLASDTTAITLKSCTLFLPAGKPIPSSGPGNARERPLGCKTIFVKGLPDRCTEDVLFEIFERCGEIDNLRFFKRNFCHVRFATEAAVDAAILLSGYRLRIGQSTDSTANSRLFIDYAQTREDKFDYECKQRQQQRELRHRERSDEKYLRPLSPDAVVPFTEHEASIVADNVKHDSSFLKAIQIMITWLERGDCQKKNANLFYSMIQSANSHIRRLLNEKVQFEEDFQKTKELLRSRINAVLVQFNQVEKVFSAASHKKVWDHFSKAQRKSIDVWKKQCSELKAMQTDEIFGKQDENEENGDEKSEIENREEFTKKQAREMSISSDSNEGDNGDGDSNENTAVRYESKRKRLKRENFEDLMKKDSEIVQLKSKLESLKTELDAIKKTQQSSAPNSISCSIEASLVCWSSLLLNVHRDGLDLEALLTYISANEPNATTSSLLQALHKFGNLFRKNEHAKWILIVHEK